MFLKSEHFSTLNTLRSGGVRFVRVHCISYCRVYKRVSITHENCHELPQTVICHKLFVNSQTVHKVK